MLFSTEDFFLEGGSKLSTSGVAEVDGVGSSAAEDSKWNVDVECFLAERLSLRICGTSRIEAKRWRKLQQYFQHMFRRGGGSAHPTPMERTWDQRQEVDRLQTHKNITWFPDGNSVRMILFLKEKGWSIIMGYGLIPSLLLADSISYQLQVTLPSSWTLEMMILNVSVCEPFRLSSVELLTRRSSGDVSRWLNQRNRPRSSPWFRLSDLWQRSHQADLVAKTEAPKFDNKIVGQQISCSKQNGGSRRAIWKVGTPTYYSFGNSSFATKWKNLDRGNTSLSLPLGIFKDLKIFKRVKNLWALTFHKNE